jgi:hypothetical protein
MEYIAHESAFLKEHVVILQVAKERGIKHAIMEHGFETLKLHSNQVQFNIIVKLV